MRTNAFVVRRLDYSAMRMLRFRRVLRDFFRRWGLYFVIAAAVFSAGSNAPIVTTAGAASLLLLPLRAAADQGWTIVPATLGYAIVGALPVLLSRPLWWPRRWADAERALPLTDDTIRRSDRLFATLVMAPWQVLLLAGWIAIGSNPDGTHHAGQRALAIGGWLVATAGALLLSLRWMRFVRGRRPGRIVVRVSSARPRASTTRPLDARRALVVSPMLRGRAAASSAVLVAGLIATGACATLSRWTSVPVGWSLALLAVASLATTSLLRARTSRELRPLWQDARQLPLDVRRCERAQRLLVLLPAFVGVAIALLVTSMSATTRPLALTGYAIVLATCCAFESAPVGSLDATHHAARWILMLALAIAFGSEVTPS